MAPVENQTPQPSTLQSVIDTATATVQSVVGSITGNTADQTAAERKKDTASAEYDASQAAVKAGPFTASSAGAVAVDDKDRTSGSWNQTVGSAKETVGGVVGSADLKAAGRQQNEEGRQQEAAGEARDYTKGLGDRVQGTLGGAVSGLTGDVAGQKHYDELHDKGKTQQRGAEIDITKQAEAEKRAA